MITEMVPVLGGNTWSEESWIGTTPINFLRQLIREGYRNDRPEQRSHLRYPLALGVSIMPLGDGDESVGPGVLAVTRDLSIAGASCYSVQPIAAERVRVTLRNLAGRTCELRMQVRRKGKIGPLYFIAGEFTGLDVSE